MQRRQFLCLLPLMAFSPLIRAKKLTPAQQLIWSARNQIGITLRYDPAYVHMPYPDGDIDRQRGVCTDVIIRAYRDAFGYDLQKAVHEDMRARFSAYPNTWGLKRPDTNIDHRRVPNLQVFLKWQYAEQSRATADYRPGDLVTQLIGGKQPHILIVSDKTTKDDRRPLAIHNIGMGAQEEDYLFGSPITGHYRFFPNREQNRTGL